jgi:hypothetical protein
LLFLLFFVFFYFFLISSFFFVYLFIISLFSQPSDLSASISYVESVGPSIERSYRFPGNVIGLDNAPLVGPSLVITAEMLDK